MQEIFQYFCIYFSLRFVVDGSRLVFSLQVANEPCLWNQPHTKS